jgi:hypothetical protein
MAGGGAERLTTREPAYLEGRLGSESSAPDGAPNAPPAANDGAMEGALGGGGSGEAPACMPFWLGGGSMELNLANGGGCTEGGRCNGGGEMVEVRRGAGREADRLASEDCPALTR